MFILIILQKFIFALEVDSAIAHNKLLPHSEIYIDYNRSESIKTIQNKTFQLNNKTLLGFGYSPEFDVWIRFELSNSSSDKVEKIIEYANPLTSSVSFFEIGYVAKLPIETGLLHLSPHQISINPIIKVTLQPYQTKVFYIKASSKITTLIIKLNIWNPKNFYKKELIHQIIMALFFGAMFITIFYNFTVFLATRELSYLYYVLFFLTVSFHHLLYKGVASLYIFSPEVMLILATYSSFIVAMPTIFLALFTQKILTLQQYPKLNTILNYFLIIYPIAIVIIQLTEAYQYRSLFFIFLLIYLFIVTSYALIQKNIQARFIILGWIMYMSSGTFMYLSSLGTYNIFENYPYLVESSLVIEIIVFSFALASKIKMLNREKIISRKRALLLTELNHRFKNSMNLILSFIFFQKEKIDNQETYEILTNLEDRIIATTELYSLLDTEDNIIVVNTKIYFHSIVDNIKESFRNQDIEIEISSNINMDSEYVVYCGLIVNEAVTNSFKYAFENIDFAKININFYMKSDKYYLIIKDNGNGFNHLPRKNSLGFYIIDTLATLQLDGELNMKTDNGVEITIIWRKNEK